MHSCTLFRMPAVIPESSFFLMLGASRAQTCASEFRISSYRLYLRADIGGVQRHIPTCPIVPLSVAPTSCITFSHSVQRCEIKINDLYLFTPHCSQISGKIFAQLFEGHDFLPSFSQASFWCLMSFLDRTVNYFHSILLLLIFLSIQQPINDRKGWLFTNVLFIAKASQTGMKAFHFGGAGRRVPFMCFNTLPNSWTVRLDSFRLGKRCGLAYRAKIHMKCAEFDTSNMNREGSCKFTGWG